MREFIQVLAVLLVLSVAVFSQQKGKEKAALRRR